MPATAAEPGARRRNRTRGLRARLPIAAVVLCCVTAVVVAVSGAATSIPGLQFLPPGHWVFNAALQSVFHVDGATATVDAVADVPGSAGSLVVQGDTSGYVVGDSRITEFDKSSLEVADDYAAPGAEVPVGVGAAGGPYLVYRDSGKVVRLGEEVVTISTGGSVGAPVVSDDGTLWLPRVGAGLLCALAQGADRVTCPVRLPEGHTGAMSVVAGEPVFVDTTADVLYEVAANELGAPRPLGVDTSAKATLASTDLGGKVVILDGARMHLVETDTDGGKPKPVTVDLPAGGQYDGPATTGSVVAVIDRKSGTLLTYDADGEAREQTPIPEESGAPRLTRGEDERLYVDGADGEHVLVVDRDGTVTDVPVTEGVQAATEADEDRDRDRDQDQVAPPPGGTVPPDNPQQEQPRQDQAAPPAQQAPRPPQQPRPEPETPVVPPTAPGAPAGVQATAGDATATVTWGAAPDNRAPITGYTISWPGGQLVATPDARSASVTGLANGTSYAFTVTATNSAGTGPGVTSAAVTPVTTFRAATSPTNLAADNETNNSTVWATWSAPADMGTGTFVHYLVDIVGVRQGTVTEESVTYNDIQVDQELTINITAVTTSPDGQQVPGATATVITGQTGGGPAAVQLSRGAATTEGCGPDPACALMHMVLSGFPPNSQVVLTSQSTEPGYPSQTTTLTTDANGAATGDAFPYAGVGYTVHVNADVNGEQTRSNDVAWTAG